MNDQSDLFLHEAIIAQCKQFIANDFEGIGGCAQAGYAIIGFALTMARNPKMRPNHRINTRIMVINAAKACHVLATVRVIFGICEVRA